MIYLQKKILLFLALVTICTTTLTSTVFASPPFVGGYIPPDVDFIYSEPQVEGFSDFPARFSLRDSGHVSPVENQGQHGTCWTFAANAVIESHMLKNGLGLHNFSELHMAYSTAHSHVGGAYAMQERPNPSDGGNHIISASYLMRSAFSGTVRESDDPYSTVLSLQSIPARNNSITRDKPRTHRVQNVMFVTKANEVGTPRTPQNQIKQALMDYGALGASMFWPLQDTNNYNPATSAFFYRNTGGIAINATNHAVTIVGWDDNYSRNNFQSALRPTNNGAWLVKNSWGADTHIQGFFWASYEDTNFPQHIWVVDGVKPYESEKNIYEYDYLPAMGGTGYGVDANQYARVFTVGSDGEQVEQVVVGAFSANTVFFVDIIPNYVNFIGHNQNTFNGRTYIIAPHPGYYTIDLPEPVRLGAANSRFAVIIRAERIGGDAFVSVGDYNAPNGTSFIFNPSLGGFYSPESLNFSIKAITGAAYDCQHCLDIGCIECRDCPYCLDLGCIECCTCQTQECVPRCKFTEYDCLYCFDGGCWWCSDCKNCLDLGCMQCCTCETSECERWCRFDFPITGVADMNAYTAVMVVFILTSAGLWIYIYKKRFLQEARKT